MKSLLPVVTIAVVLSVMVFVFVDHLNNDAKQQLVAESVTVTSSLAAELSQSRPVLTRQELEVNESVWMKKFNITKTVGGSSATLYSTHDENVKDTLVDFKHNGLILKLPYNDGWGFPHYTLSLYEIQDNIALFGKMDPCPEGCLESGAVVYGRIEFTEQTLDEAVAAFVLESEERFFGKIECKNIQLNSSVQAVLCKDKETWLPLPTVFIQGSLYAYKIQGLECVTDFQETNFYTPEEARHCNEIKDGVRVE